jgi:hypothetical protein
VHPEFDTLGLFTGVSITLVLVALFSFLYYGRWIDCGGMGEGPD